MDDALSRVEPNQSRQFVRLAPWRAIIVALTVSFLLFLSLDLLESAFTGQILWSVERVWHFIRGFLGTLAGMMFVWLAMHEKEMELIDLRDRLQQQLKKRTTELNCLRSDILAVIKHRLMTPIAATDRTVGLLLEGEFGKLSEQQAQILRHVLDNNADAKRLLEMLVDIYKYKDGAKQLDKEEIQLADLVQELVLALNSSAATKRVELVTSGEGTIMGDRAEIEKLVQHLLDNAIKHAASRVEVKSIRKDDRAVISVHDDGSGIDPKDVANLFDRFYIFSSGGKYAAMTGVGLCLCSAIAQAHGGDIACESAPGDGTSMIISLPA